MAELSKTSEVGSEGLQLALSQRIGSVRDASAEVLDSLF